MNRRHALCGAMLAAALAAGAQQIQTAQSFFEQVSAAFGEIKDYTASFTLQRGDTVSAGTLYYKSPNLMRMDFTTPAGQVLLMDGKSLQIYVPQADLILSQSLKSRSASELEALASSRALRIFQEGYDIAYLTSPAPVPLGGGSTEPVTKLRLQRRLAREMYREIILSIDANRMIRRLEGTLEDQTLVIMDYGSIRLNQGIPASRFREGDWADANRVDNFLTGGN